MKWNYFIATLIYYPFCCSAEEYSSNKAYLQINTPKNKNTIERALTNEQDWSIIKQNRLTRSTDYPTQVIRLDQNVAVQEKSCAQVNEQIDKIFVHKITKDKFSFTTFIVCTYDPETKLATKFTLNSYFDPISDEGIDYLKSYLNEYNGTNLLGTPFVIESAHSLIVALNFSVGTKKNPATPPFILFRQDRNNLYFKNTYEMKNTLLKDISDYFFSDESEKVLPFLNKWLFDYAGGVYKAILRDSNYTLLEPDRIYLMDSGEPLYVSPIKFYYGNNCALYETKHCLNTGTIH
jgi:hypothetical protein